MTTPNKQATVKELIEFLQKLPENTIVRHTHFYEGMWGGGHIGTVDTAIPELKFFDNGTPYVDEEGGIEFYSEYKHTNGTYNPPVITFGN